MPQQGVLERIATSRITATLLTRPRVLAFLLVVTLAIALQGSGVALDGDYTVGRDEWGTTETGPGSDPDD